MPEDWISKFFDDEASEAKQPSKKSQEITSTFDKELQGRIKSLQKRHDDLKKHLEDVLLSAGWTTQGIKDYLNNPNNFTPLQWQMLQARKRGNQKLSKWLVQKVKQDPKLRKKKRLLKSVREKPWELEKSGCPYANL